MSHDASPPAGPLRVYIAKKILTMEPGMPEASAVAVRDGRIVEVGTLATLRRSLKGVELQVDDRFADKVLMPGFVDPHLHPWLGALLSNFDFITPDAWSLPGRTTSRVAGRDAYVARLHEGVEALQDHAAPYITWGYHPLFHGRISRSDLDGWFPDRPVILWHRSFHEVYVNTTALKAMGLQSREDLPEDVSLDWDAGHFYESGLFPIVYRMQDFLLAMVARGLPRFAELVHRGGITTCADMAAGGMGDMSEEWAHNQSLEAADVPFRVLLVPDAKALLHHAGSPEAALDLAEEYRQTYSSRRFWFSDHVKLLADGGFFGQMMKMGAPGFHDGHEGQWMTPPDQLASLAKVFWEAGYHLHVHTNGDGGAQEVLDLLARLLDARPRFDHRFCMEHWGYATEDQNRRLQRLGGVVSGQPWYLHVLAEAYTETGMGFERASQMCRFGSLQRLGVPLALHSDFTMAPLAPLRLAWAASTRMSMGGNVYAPEEMLGIERAMRAITIDAAFVLGLEDEVGSIRHGKRADFTVLRHNPFEVGPQGLDRMEVLGVVFEGEPRPLVGSDAENPAPLDEAEIELFYRSRELPLPAARGVWEAIHGHTHEGFGCACGLATGFGRLRALASWARGQLQQPVPPEEPTGV